MTTKQIFLCIYTLLTGILVITFLHLVFNVQNTDINIDPQSGFTCMNESYVLFGGLLVAMCGVFSIVCVSFVKSLKN